MHYLIDGNNLLHAVPKARERFACDREAGKRILLDLLLDYANRSRHSLTVVFDGGDGRRRKEAPGFLVIEADFADRVLLALLCRGPGVFVSSDGELVREARRSGFSSVRAAEFAATIEPPPEAGLDDKPRLPESRREVAEWKAWLGLSERDLQG